MAILKLSKRILLILLGILLAISSIIAVVIYTIENPYINSSEIQKCDEDSRSEFVANGRPLYIFMYGYETNEIKKTKISLIQNKNSKFHPLDINDNIYFTNGKVSKLDTILIEINSNKIKLYDFVNEGEKIKAGQHKGHYSCDLSYMEGDMKVYTTSDTIYINKSK
jgi:hypothetical protein